MESALDTVAELFNSNQLRVVAYLLGGALCALASVRLYAGGARRTSVAFWLVLTLVMLTMGVSRMVDLGPLLTDHGRDIARDYGWYEDRRTLQRTAVEAVIIGGVVGALVAAAWLAFAAAPEHPLAAMAIVYLATFVAVRAISLHQVDQLLYNHPIEGVRVNALLELGGIAAVCLAAVVSLALRTPRRLQSI
jgi:hypothetical protein